MTTKNTHCVLNKHIARMNMLLNLSLSVRRRVVEEPLTAIVQDPMALSLGCQKDHALDENFRFFGFKF